MPKTGGLLRILRTGRKMRENLRQVSLLRWTLLFSYSGHQVAEWN